MAIDDGVLWAKINAAPYDTETDVPVADALNDPNGGGAGRVSLGVVSKDRFLNDFAPLIVAINSWLETAADKTTRDYQIVAGLKLLMDSNGTEIHYDNAVFGAGMAAVVWVNGRAVGVVTLA